MAPPFIRQTSAYIFVIEILKYTFCFGSVGVFVSSSTVKLLPHGEKTVQKQNLRFSQHVLDSRRTCGYLPAHKKLLSIINISLFLATLLQTGK